MPGMFITFEGGEGAGQATQIATLAARLRAAGHTVALTREPGGSPGADIIRHVVLSGAAKPFGPEIEAMMYAAARADHIEETIKPALERGEVVICQGFIDSTRVYQGYVGKVAMAEIRALETATLGALMPDLTLILDIDAAISLARAKPRAGASINDKLAFHDKLRQGFLHIARKEPKRCVVIDASREADRVAADIWAAVEARLS